MQRYVTDSVASVPTGFYVAIRLARPFPSIPVAAIDYLRSCDGSKDDKGGHPAVEDGRPHLLTRIHAPLSKIVKDTFGINWSFQMIFSKSFTGKKIYSWP